MNKEIKYRAWDKQDKKMIFINTVDLETGSDYFTNDRYIIMRYTGMGDTDSYPIYENDIVIHPKIGIVDETDKRYIVEWYQGAFVVRGYNSSNGSSYYRLWSSYRTRHWDQTIKKVGHVYENQKLIEKHE